MIHAQGRQAPAVSHMARELRGSLILKIAAEIREMLARGEEVTDLTLGDFRPDQFPIPKDLTALVQEAIGRGETNYPPSDGIKDLRQAVATLYRERLGLDYSAAEVVIAGGVRPAIYGACRTVLDPGDGLLYSVPCWNTNHYAWLAGARPLEVITEAGAHFMPSAEGLEPHLGRARLLILNSPQNPAGTAFTADVLERIVKLVVDENDARARRGATPLVLLYDQVYWMLTFGGVRHVTPVGIDPRVREYTLFTDGISKGFAATGLRVGWCVGPEEYLRPLSALLGHVGAWAPRPEQVAVAQFLADGAAIDAYHRIMKAGIERRFAALHAGFTQLRARGYPVDWLAPQSTIYMSARFDLIGRRAAGREFRTNEEIRSFLLAEAKVGVVPFQAFGYPEENGWFRLSVGALPESAVEPMFERLAGALDLVS